ncbi:TonB-dependent receptor [Parabacteroides sp. AM58-2XD]|uniref:SusC/RagA family TonB-linked outer membrane protein n=1 Tax=Parabacteroides TaxID=375288 RepID=UPI000FE27046|nr:MULTISPECIES: TonB-dependent receptor [Parabacteroides]RGY94413.1 TonB-dependent receptor [Parabacteroides sp. AM58-2XD]GKG71355.1 SusC/RagA family TonB-linked outer membrane protein [Parabacteroides goldsteinii]GKG77308.1 SusC/RagA family TonB-linked outer membrane protein [Parabacteroides goldsteinii]
MKRLRFKALLMLIAGLCMSVSVFAQQMTVTGVVKDPTGEPVIGANVIIKGTTNGTVTDIDGKFLLSASKGDIISVSFIGYKMQELPATSDMNIILVEDSQMLENVVVIGYGTVKKNDATGSVIAIKPDEKNRGLQVSPQDMLMGKVAGVSVASSTGQPGSSSSIRIRGGSSLSAKNDPLVVIDGVIMGNSAPDGLSNPLSTINPSDIESFTVLKDASATAIYGSRASNGVIIITTKKGKSGSVKINYSGNVSVSTKRNKVDVMSGDEYRDYITNAPNTTEGMLNALNLFPNVSTDWQDEVLRTAISTDHNISAYGSVKEFMPYRVSFGYTDQNGILKTSNFQRYTGSVSLTPSFFQDHLNVNLNGKGVYIKNRFADTGALGSAVSFDPTKPVTNGSKYGGYFTWTGDYTPDGTRATSAGVNPVSMLEMVDDRSTAKSFIGNAQFDYKLHFLPDLRFNMNMGIDYTSVEGKKYVDPNAPGSYQPDDDATGSNRIYNSTHKNKLFDFYAQYSKELPSVASRFDVMAGYSYQSYQTQTDNVTYYLSRKPETFGQNTTVSNEYKETDTKYVLASFYGRMNYSLMDKYLLTFTLRDDASSRFAKDKRWGLFPSLALGWKMNEESFMKDFSSLDELKLRLGWGVTGQQDINQGDYPYLSFYREGKGGAMYPVYDAAGNVTWINVLAPTAVNPNLKWETTTTYNVGIDYGFLNGRITGSLDGYIRKTKDLINAEVNVPAGTDFAEYVVSNIGSLENKGVEFSINTRPIVSRDFSWDLGFNIAYNKTKITELTYNDNSDSPGKRFESTGGDGGLRLKIHSVGYAPGTFYVFQQVYDADGNPIEGEYVDRNGDGVITDNDLYRYKKPTADVLMGFNSKFTYKQWDLGFNGRVSLGNYNFNSTAANAALGVNELFGNNALSNKPTSALKTGFQSRQRLSDYYIQNASFLKIDNITLGYNVDKFIKSSWNARFYATVQNPIIITKYDGLDPEVNDGMDNNVYPRPITVLFGVNINF